MPIDMITLRGATSGAGGRRCPAGRSAWRQRRSRPLQRRQLVLPISIRPALLAAVSIVIDRRPDAIEALAGATIGGYQVQFEKIVLQLRAEIRIRQVV